ncbi:hypothetical protein LTR85_009196 [Meristemomyces frigidus]|nr:hypothetical protein LTR85_009196 [Meristemomyces frigidus]
MLDDYLIMLYPLVPVVHRPSFRESLASKREVEDSDFLALIFAICAAVIGTMPSKFQQYRRHTPPLPFATRKDMLNRCHTLLLDARRPSYFDEISFQKWATSYLMVIASFGVGEHNRARMTEVESMQLGRLLHFHRLSEYEGLNPIEVQLRKKGFWLLFYGYVHSHVQNLRKERLTFLDPEILDSIDLEALMPLDVDDEGISEHAVVSQSSPDACLTSGFIIHSRIFWKALQGKPRGGDDSIHHCSHSQHRDQQFDNVRKRLHELKYALNGIPSRLHAWAPQAQVDHSDGSEDSTNVVRTQFATMRANLHVTHLWLQSVLLDQLDVLAQEERRPQDTSASLATVEARWTERENLCSQLLHVLHSIPQEHVEPNGLHLAYKVRDVAVGLFSCPFEPDDPASLRAGEYVRCFTDLLSRLDGSETVNTTNLQSWVDIDRERKRHTSEYAISDSSWLGWA